MIEYKTLVLAVPHVLRPCRGGGRRLGKRRLFSVRGQRVGRSERAGETVRSRYDKAATGGALPYKNRRTSIPVSARMDIDGVIIMFIDSSPVSRALPDRPEPRPVDRCSGGGRGGVSVYMRSREIWGKNSSRLRWLKNDGTHGHHDEDPSCMYEVG